MAVHTLGAPMITEHQSSCLSTMFTALHSEVRQAMILGMILSMLLRASITGDRVLLSFWAMESCNGPINDQKIPKTTLDQNTRTGGHKVSKCVLVSQEIYSSLTFTKIKLDILLLS